MIRYDLLCDVQRTSVFIRLSGNEGGGYFSREKIDFDKALECVANINSGRPLPSKVFASAFTGKSSNNAGFLAAVLREEQLLDAAPGTDFQHVASGDWSAWKAELLNLEGTPLVEPSRADATNTSSDTSGDPVSADKANKEHTKEARSRKKHAPADRQ
jgi:hypothetical protein